MYQRAHLHDTKPKPVSAEGDVEFKTDLVLHSNIPLGYARKQFVSVLGTSCCTVCPLSPMKERDNAAIADPNRERSVIAVNFV